MKIKELFKITNNPIIWGVSLLALFILSFCMWGSFAQINSAAVTHGTVALDSNRKIIQHLEGGIIKQILVKDGDFVEKGQLLIELRNTLSKANLDLFEKQLTTYIANKTRLLAEQQNKNILTFENININKEETKIIIANQKELFFSRKKTLSGKIDILNKKIEQLNEQINELEIKNQSIKKQLLLIQEEKEIVTNLVLAGNETKPKLLVLQRQEIEFKSTFEEINSNITRLNKAINQTKLEITNLKNEQQNQIAEQLFETQTNIHNLKERIISAKDILNRCKIKSPKSGIIINLKFHTKGGVIPPASEIMTIIPQDDNLIIETNLMPQDIDIVHKGLTAKIRLLAYRSRYTPLVTGKVIYVSPDKITDPMTRMVYYSLRVKINTEELANLKNIELYPGMPAEVLIVTGSRTFFTYLFDPIKKTFRKAFRED
jgi:HlyD family secretion protein